MEFIFRPLGIHIFPAISTYCLVLDQIRSPRVSLCGKGLPRALLNEFLVSKLLAEELHAISHCIHPGVIFSLN